MVSSRAFGRPSAALSQKATRISPELKTAWRQVSKHPPFPILEETREALRQAFNRRFVSHAQLESIVESDPALCWHLANNATRKNPNCREQINGAISCLSLLGMQEAIYVAKRLDVVSTKETDIGRRYYRQALLTGHFAARLAKQFCQTMTLDRRQQHLYFWATSLAQSALWPWWQTYEDMPRWLMRMAMGQDPLNGLIKLLGNDWSLWQPLARKGVLPDLALAALNPNHFPTSKEWQLLRCNNPRLFIRSSKSHRIGRPTAIKNDSLDCRALMHKCQSGSLIILCATMIAWLCFTRPSGNRLQRWLIITANASGQRPQDVLKQLRDTQRQLVIHPEYQQTIGWDLCAGTESLMRRIQGFSHPNPGSDDLSNNQQDYSANKSEKIPPDLLIKALPSSLKTLADDIYPPKEKDSLRCVMQKLIDGLSEQLTVAVAELWLIDKQRIKLNKVYQVEKGLDESASQNKNENKNCQSTITGEKGDNNEIFELTNHPELAQWFNENNKNINTLTAIKISSSNYFPFKEHCQINPLIIDDRVIAIVLTHHLDHGSDQTHHSQIISELCQITSAGLAIIHKRLYPSV